MRDACELLSLETDDVVRFDVSLAIGRHPDGDLVLPHGVISTRHAVVEWVDGCWRVRDLGSRNGTSVNRRRIQGWQKLAEGDLVRFANCSAWRIQRLVPPPDHREFATVRPTEGPTATSLRPLTVRLRYDGPELGTIQARLGDETFEAQAGYPFILLAILARDAGVWVRDRDLKSALWGRRAKRISRSALHTLLHNTRRMFARWGIDGSIVEKKRGYTRLGLDPSQIELCGRRSEPDGGRSR